MPRTVFYVSDSTGITARTLGQSLLAQFAGLDLEHVTVPFVADTIAMHELVARIDAVGRQQGCQPLVFSTIVDPALRALLATSHGCLLDILGVFRAALEQTLGVPSGSQVGGARPRANDASYQQRIDAVHFALDNDDGARLGQYDEADVILVGVSRCGKTPTCLYLALQFGLFAANYPLTPEELGSLQLPRALTAYQGKLFGLTIDAERLSAIRQARRPDSQYASLRQCALEVGEAAALFQQQRVPSVDTTALSIEEISARIIDWLGSRSASAEISPGR
jgi:regulator of PEP synthase PpsR (kinase-PPPase family)